MNGGDQPVCREVTRPRLVVVDHLLEGAAHPLGLDHRPERGAGRGDPDRGGDDLTPEAGADGRGPGPQGIPAGAGPPPAPAPPPAPPARARAPPPPPAPAHGQ